MKLFNTIQELWDYSILCPICSKERKMDVSIGPDSSIDLISFNKVAHYLELDASFVKRDVAYAVNYRINCLGNTFEANVIGASPLQPVRAHPDTEEALKHYFYFYIQGFCRNCEYSSTVHSLDLEPDVHEGTISNIGLERESYFLLKTEDKFHVTFIHDSNIMLVSKFENQEGMCVESEKHIELPLVRIDLSDQEKAAHRIKTLILFS